MISSIRTNTQQYQLNQQGLAKRRTLVNALNTIDAQSMKYRMTADNAQRAYIAIPTVLTVIPATITAPIMFYKKGASKFTVPALFFSGLSILTYGIFTKKRGDNCYKSIIAGQQDALEKDLSDPKLFLTLDEKRVNVINENPVYQNVINTNTEVDRSNFFLGYYFKKYKNFFKDIDKRTQKIEHPEAPANSQLAQAINFIDNRAQNYNNKIVTGMHLLYSGLCAVGAGVGLALYTAAKKHKKFSIPLKLGAVASAVAPICALTKISQKSFFSDIEQISRIKAKEDFLNGNNSEDKNCLKSYFDYNKSKDVYIQKLNKQEMISAIRNDIIKNSAADEKELAEASEFQQEFMSAINSKERTDKFRRVALNNSFTSDFIFNVAASSVLYPMLLAINQQFGIVANKTSRILKFGILAGVTMTGSCLINTGLSKFLNKKSDSQYRF